MAAVSELPWEELHGNLRAFISRRVRNPADVDDLVQRVLLQIVKGLASLRDAERLHAWVYRTARNVIVDYYRSSTASARSRQRRSRRTWQRPVTRVRLPPRTMSAPRFRNSPPA